MYEKDKIPNYICQGDLFLRFNEEILPPVNPPELAFMILNNTCDLIHQEDLEFICICPVFNIEVIIQAFLNKSEKKVKENILNGLRSKLIELSNNKKKFFFFLSPILEHKFPPAFADFSQISRISKEHLQNILRNRISVLKNPWREKLGWMIGNVFNRVAIEDVNIEVIDNYINKDEVLNNFFLRKTQ